MHVRVTDGVGPVLLALHMSPLSGRMWIPLMERLDRPTVAPDRLGFGFSDPPPRPLTMDEYAAATLDALDAVHPGAVVDVIGQHTGSVEAVALAHRAPTRVRKIGLIALPVYTEEETAERLGTRGAPPPVPDIEGSHLAALWQRRLQYRSPPYDFGYLHELTVDELVSAGPHLAYRAVFSYPMADKLATLPVAVVVFVPHDDLYEQTERYAGLLGDATCVDLPDLALDIFHEAPDRMAALVEEHLGRGAEPISSDEDV